MNIYILRTSHIFYLNVGALVESSSFSVAVLYVSETKISGLWEVFFVSFGYDPSLLEGNVHGIFFSFLSANGGDVIHSFEILGFWFHHLHIL